MEAEHREILRQALPDDSFMGDKSFDEMAAELRKRIAGRNLTPSEDLIREGRDER
jgi:antitoxin FitA